MLNAHERRQLRIIAHRLAHDDPALAQSLSGRRVAKRDTHWIPVLFAAVAVVLAALTIVTAVHMLFFLACVAAVGAIWTACVANA